MSVASLLLVTIPVLTLGITLLLLHRNFAASMNLLELIR